MNTYFVLNGLLNGEEGVRALTCGFGAQQPDGWYWLNDGEEDGHGPFGSRQLAERAAAMGKLAHREEAIAQASERLESLISETGAETADDVLHLANELMMEIEEEYDVRLTVTPTENGAAFK